MRYASLAALLCLCSCNLGRGADLRDGGADAADGSAGDADLTDGRADSARDGGPDGQPDAAPAGPITLVAREAAFVTDRPCDLDGDALGDNAIADLGEPGATILAASMSAILDVTLGEGARWVLHMPRVDAPAGPHDETVTVASFSAVDEEECDHRETEGDDDFSGHEPFCAKVEHLDGCGEPLSFTREGALSNGYLIASGWSAVFGTTVPMYFRRASLEGTVAPHGASADLTLCGYMAASDLAGMADEDDPDVPSELEELLAGGSAFGMPSIPGMEVDIDVDGDGLERFELDGDFHIVRCVDGDGTAIEGDQCWRDERIADGFSFTVQASFVSAVYWMREPRWDERECGIIFRRMESSRDIPSAKAKIRLICPEHRSLLDAVIECAREACADQCVDPRFGCQDCAEARCPVEVDACNAAPPCCPEPPEVSVWDPA